MEAHDLINQLEFVSTRPGTIDALPGELRIVRDLDCPVCGFPELGQTASSDPEARQYVYCRKCNSIAKLSAGVVRGRAPSCGSRHWYAYPGAVGSSSPICKRCGEPNPKYRPEDDPQGVTS